MPDDFRPPSDAIAAGAAPVLPPVAVASPRAVPANLGQGSGGTPDKKKEGHHDGGFRELVETVVFVVVLVLLLKTFLAEAFVIPTGSMATTLLGYHRDVTCVQCGYRFKVNASNEVDPQDGILDTLLYCRCANCGFKNLFVHPKDANGREKDGPVRENGEAP